MTQPFLRGFESAGVDRKLKFFAGFCFGWKTSSKDLYPWVHGVVTTPRWLERSLRDVQSELPLVLDNGAFPAFRDGVDLPYEAQIEGLQTAIDAASDRIESVVWPDVVGDPRATIERLLRAEGDLDRTIRPLIPIQEGMPPEFVLDFASSMDAGVFVGGRTRRWKLETVNQLRTKSSEILIHVGRISSVGHLHTACMNGASSFDTTTFMQSRGANQRTDYRPRLQRYTQRRIA